MKLNSERLQGLIQNTEIIYLTQVDSTNSEAKRMAQRGCGESVLVISECQSGGRGRMGRSFYSAVGGIYMTYMRRVYGSIGDTVCVTTAAAAFVASGLCRYCLGEFGIKWVNDIYLGEKKVCGILSESTRGSDGGLYVLVGIGINLGSTEFPEDIRDIAGSAGACSDPEGLIGDIICGLEGFFCNPKDREYMNIYREKFMLTGRYVRAFGGMSEVFGTVLGVDDDGALVLLPEGENDSIRITSGEVSVRVFRGT